MPCLGSFVEKVRGHKQEIESAVPWIVPGSSLGPYTGNECTWTVLERSQVPQTGKDSTILGLYPRKCLRLIVVSGSSQGSLTGN